MKHNQSKYWPQKCVRECLCAINAIKAKRVRECESYNVYKWLKWILSFGNFIRAIIIFDAFYSIDWYTSKTHAHTHTQVMFVSFGFCDSFYPLCDECSIPVFTPQHQFRHCIARANRQIMNNESTTKTYSPLDIYFARFELNQSLHKVPSNKLWSKHDGTVRRKKAPRNRTTPEHTQQPNFWSNSIRVFAGFLTNNNSIVFEECYEQGKKRKHIYRIRKVAFESSVNSLTCSWSEKQSQPNEKVKTIFSKTMVVLVFMCPCGCGCEWVCVWACFGRMLSAFVAWNKIRSLCGNKVL